MSETHVDGKWCTDLHCSKCYSADTWQKSELAAAKGLDGFLQVALDQKIAQIKALESALSERDERIADLERQLATKYSDLIFTQRRESNVEVCSLKFAEDLWAELERDQLGGYSGINRPFYIKYKINELFKSIAPPQAPCTTEKSDKDEGGLKCPVPPQEARKHSVYRDAGNDSDETKPVPVQPASGAAQCPSCGSEYFNVRRQIGSMQGLHYSCVDRWHNDPTVPASSTDQCPMCKRRNRASRVCLAEDLGFHGTYTTTCPDEWHDGSAPPFANCKYQICDLPGQCVSEGKCHHPRDDSAPAADTLTGTPSNKGVASAAGGGDTPIGYRYLRSYPFGGEFWDFDDREKNGHKPTKSEPIYSQEQYQNLLHQRDEARRELAQAKARIDDLLWAAKIANDESEQIIAELRQVQG